MPRYQNGNSSTFLFDYRWIDPLQDFELTEDEAKRANMTKLLAADICRQYPESGGEATKNVVTIITTPMNVSESGTTITPPPDKDANDEEADFVQEDTRNALLQQAEKNASRAVVYNEGGAELAKSSEQLAAEQKQARDLAREAGQGRDNPTVFDPNVSSADTTEVVNSVEEINETHPPEATNTAQKDGDSTKEPKTPKKTK